MSCLLAIAQTWVSEIVSYGWLDPSSYCVEKRVKGLMRDMMGSQWNMPREGSWQLGPGCSDRR